MVWGCGVDCAKTSNLSIKVVCWSGDSTYTAGTGNTFSLCGAYPAGAGMSAGRRAAATVRYLRFLQSLAVMALGPLRYRRPFTDHFSPPVSPIIPTLRIKPFDMVLNSLQICHAAIRAVSQGANMVTHHSIHRAHPSVSQAPCTCPL